LCQGSAQSRAAGGEQRAFQQNLPQNAATRRAQGHPNGHFAPLHTGPGQHQVGEVGARDQEHQSGDCQQNLERRIVLVAQITDPGAGRIRSQAKGFEGFQGIGTVPVGRSLREESGAESVKIFRRLSQSPARLEPSHYGVDKHLAARMGRRAGGIGKVESGRLRPFRRTTAE
jgi:hypothetical protein